MRLFESRCRDFFSISYPDIRYYNKMGCEWRRFLFRWSIGFCKFFKPPSRLFRRHLGCFGFFHALFPWEGNQLLIIENRPQWSMLTEISGLTYPSDIKKLEKRQRNHILKLACDNGANPRQIARITGISYGVIFNAKMIIENRPQWSVSCILNFMFFGMFWPFKDTT